MPPRERAQHLWSRLRFAHNAVHADGIASQDARSPLDLSCMVDSAYSMADWSVKPTSTVATASYGSAGSRDTQPVAKARPADAERDTSATLAALDSMYTALSSLGFQQVRTHLLPGKLSYLGTPRLTSSTCTCALRLFVWPCQDPWTPASMSRVRAGLPCMPVELVAI